MPHQTTCDCIVIGAGFYGCEIALELRRLGCARVVVAERESGIMRRASFVNQARIHNGYHYPRSAATALRSHENFELFVERYADAVLFEMGSIYAIARDSRVSATQFEQFCRLIGAPCRPAFEHHRRLFEPAMIEECFLTRELTFDARRLAERLRAQIERAGIDLRLEAPTRVLAVDDGAVAVDIAGRTERAPFVVNCTYADLESAGVRLRTHVKKELTEMLLIRPPPALAGLGITVMDGPFFSVMPFPAARLHSLSHVRYTPHGAFHDDQQRSSAPRHSHREPMIRDASRYLPPLAGAEVVQSMFEIKAVLVRNEDDDGRPILIEESEDSPRILSVLGSKLDNVFDALRFIRTKDWSSPHG